MNQRNVEALALLLEEMEGGVGAACSRCRSNAEFLASRGVLGPASEVLTWPETKHLLNTGPGSSPLTKEEMSLSLVQDLERIAQGKI